MILTEDKREDFHKTIGFGKRIGWLRQGEEAFLKPGGILEGYKVARFGSLRKKLASAGNHVLQLFNAKSHNYDESNPTKDLPSYVKHLFDYFEWKKDNNANRNDGIQQHGEIGRSLIGQQVSLSNSDDEFLLCSTRAEPNRT